MQLMYAVLFDATTKIKSEILSLYVSCMVVYSEFSALTSSFVLDLDQAKQQHINHLNV